MISLQNRPVLLITTDYVLDETLTVLLYHSGRDAALTFGETVQRSRNTKLIHINAAAWDSAWQWFKKYTDKVWAFTDCTSFATMERLELVQAFAFDHHFEQAGFQLWPR
ncbi:MAG TPA: PIN domain-containing protein [Thermoflexia bacterium]|nr:PIN domain-containing protein [Thermoflexia bacterium]